MQGNCAMRKRKSEGRGLSWLGGFICGVSLIASFGLTGTALAFAESPALEEVRLAYLDPGSGSFVVQALIAMFAGIAVTVRLYWAKIRSLLGMGSARSDDDYTDDDYTDDDDNDDTSRQEDARHNDA